MHPLDPNVCVPINDFGPIGQVGAPVLLHQVRSRLPDAFTNDKHWSDQIADALADGYSTAAEIRLLLKRDARTYSLREMLLAFHWFFRGVSACEGEHTLEYRMRHLRLTDRQQSK